MAITPTPLDTPEAPKQRQMSFLGHLEELRWHIIRIVLALIVFMVASFFFLEELMTRVILGPLRSDFPTNRLICDIDPSQCTKGMYIGPVTFQATSPTEQFSKAILVGLVAGLVAAFPYVVWELWRFIAPGLSKKERGMTRGAVGAISFLFFSGVLFTYFIILPFTFRFLANFQLMPGVENNWRAGDVVSLVSTFCLAGGLVFQMPVVAYILTRIGLLGPRMMRKYRKHALVVIVIVAGVLTPSPDAMSQLLLAAPIVVLYEVSIFISAGVKRKSQERFEAFMNE